MCGVIKEREVRKGKGDQKYQIKSIPKAPNLCRCFSSAVASAKILLKPYLKILENTEEQKKLTNMFQASRNLSKIIPRAIRAYKGSTVNQGLRGRKGI